MFLGMFRFNFLIKCKVLLYILEVFIFVVSGVGVCCFKEFFVFKYCCIFCFIICIFLNLILVYIYLCLYNLFFMFVSFVFKFLLVLFLKIVH